MPPPPPPPSRDSGPFPGSVRGSRGRPPPRYRRHPKPPYSYLALIALVIRAAPGRRLKLAQILQELSSLFPFFGGGYQGWKDSIRHNLSSNPCFAKVLKDPAKPKAKGNYWTVDVSRIPPAALRLQNTAVARGGAAAFARDLAPFVLRGCPYPSGTPTLTPTPTPAPGPPPRRRRRGSSGFSIASLLREFPEGGDPSGKSGTPPPASGDPPPSGLWGSAPILHLAAPPAPSWVPPTPGPPRGGHSGGSGVPSCDTEGGPRVPPPAWGQLPTSYSTAVAPNAVAPPSGPPFLALRWGVLPPGPPLPPTPQPEGGAQAVPPNKSIYDVWLSHPGDILHPTMHG
ncbi:forkhead box protein H1 [Calonectris borealis]|uniref:forkhead box protein H1 n=1 Tax=Calonectris borealis TaxID=1323832 RepID=UPI003F4B07C0